MEAIQRRLAVMDATALTLCMENRLPIHVFNMDDPGNIARILAGEQVGTLVSTPCRVSARARGARRVILPAMPRLPATPMIDELLEDARERMHKSVEATAHELGSVRTGPRQPGAARPRSTSTTTARRRRSSSWRRSPRRRRGC